MAPPGAGAMALVSIPLVQGKAEEALALFKDHALGIKYTQSQKGALSFDFGIHTPRRRKSQTAGSGGTSAFGAVA